MSRRLGPTYKSALGALGAYAAVAFTPYVSGVQTAVCLLGGAVGFAMTLLVLHVDRLQQRIDALERREP